jgi:hypothetical protein
LSVHNIMGKGINYIATCRPTVEANRSSQWQMNGQICGICARMNHSWLAVWTKEKENKKWIEDSLSVTRIDNIMEWRNKSKSKQTYTYNSFRRR